MGCAGTPSALCGLRGGLGGPGTLGGARRTGDAGVGYSGDAWVVR